MKSWIWEHLADPVLERVASRIEHLRARQRVMHDGASWRSVATIGHGVSIHKDSVLIGSSSPDTVRIGEIGRASCRERVLVQV